MRRKYELTARGRGAKARRRHVAKKRTEKNTMKTLSGASSQSKRQRNVGAGWEACQKNQTPETDKHGMPINPSVAGYFFPQGLLISLANKTRLLYQKLSGAMHRTSKADTSQPTMKISEVGCCHRRPGFLYSLESTRRRRNLTRPAVQPRTSLFFVR